MVCGGKPPSPPDSVGLVLVEGVDFSATAKNEKLHFNHLGTYL